MDDKIKALWRENVTDEMFNSLMLSVCESVKKYFLDERHSRWTPVLHVVVVDDEKPHFRAFPFKMPEVAGRLEQIAQQALICAASEPRPFVAFFLVTMGWSVNTTAPEDYHGNIADDTNRLENIIVSGATPDSRFNVALLDIKRHGKKRYIEIINTTTIPAGTNLDSGQSNIMGAVITGYIEGFKAFHRKGLPSWK